MLSKPPFFVNFSNFRANIVFFFEKYCDIMNTDFCGFYQAYYITYYIFTE